MKTYFQTPITSAIDARHFLTSLFNNGLDFHPDDRADSIVNTASGLPIFAPNECPYIDARMREVFNYMDCPYTFIMDLNNIKN
jgi:hypothetical protein